MKNERRLLIFAVVLGLLSWLADGFVDWMFFGESGRGLWDELLIDLTSRMLYFRSVLLLCFVLLGVVGSRLLGARRRAQESLQASEESLSTTLRSIGDAVIAADAAQRVTFLNPVAEQLTGWPAEAAVGKPLDFVLHLVQESSGERLDNPFAPAQHGDAESGPAGHLLLVAREGSRRPVESRVTPITDRNGRAAGAVMVFRDLTEQRRAVEALRREKELAQKYLTIAGSIIVVLDAHGRVTLINRKGCDLLGRDEPDVLGKNWFDEFLPERLRGAVKMVFSRLMAGDLSPDAVEFYENPVRTRSGEERVIAWHNTVITDEHGAPVGTLSSGEDVTDHQRDFAALQESEERFRTIFAAAEDCIFIKDSELRYTHINPSMERVLGITAADAIGRPSDGLVGIALGEHARETDEQVLRGERVEEEITRPINGQPATFHLIKLPIRDHSGAITGICGIARNITHRKRSEDALRDNEARLQRQNAALAKLDMRRLLSGGDLLSAVRKIAEAAAEALQVERIGVWLFTDDRAKIRCLDQFERSRKLHTDGVELVVAEYPAYFRALEADRTLAAADARSDPRTGEFTDGYLAPLGITSMMASPVRADGQITGIVCCEHVGPRRPWALDEQNFAGSMADLVALTLQFTERNRAQQALRESEEKYRSLVERANDGITIVQDARLVYVNPRLAETLGYAVGELTGTPYADYIYPDELEFIRDRYARRMAGENVPAVYETALRHRDGRRIDVELNAGIVAYQGTAADLVFVRDITERRLAEQRLRRSEERYRTIIDNTFDLVYSYAGDGSITFVGQQVSRFGYPPDEVVGRKFTDFVHPDDLERVLRDLARSLRTGAGVPSEFRLIGKNGAIHHVEESGGVIRDGDRVVEGIGVIREVTERKRAEEALRYSEAQLRQSQKMEAVGRLAGGVAHDFNNLLAIITGHSELLRHRLSSDHPLLHNAREINEAAQRAADLTRQLLAFSRKQVLEPKTLNLNTVIANLENMLQRLIGEDIALIVAPDPQVGMTRADPGQIEQVLMNLVVNARDAMPRGGMLTIETSNVDVADAGTGESPAGAPGPQVMISISDTGQGMDAEVKAHIFEPFFTTKESGKGTGLGLSTVYGIVTQSGGNIEVDSEPGTGTQFRVYLPRVDESEDAPGNVRAIESLPRGRETILVVEDELGVRDLLCGALRRMGYQVLAADDGVAALQVSERHKGPIDLLLTDVVMPWMSGLDLAERLIPDRPEMKVMYMSGYTDHLVVLASAGGESGPFLQKPFAMDYLCRAVRAVLDGKPEMIPTTIPASVAESGIARAGQ